MKKALETVFHVGPLIFAAGFLWPLLAQIALRLGAERETAWIAAAGLAVVLGVQAQWRGRWI